MSHANSRKITIFRLSSFVQEAQGADTDDFFSQSKQSIGSCYESSTSTKILSGLTLKEEDLLMPYLLDMDKEDREFRKQVKNFFAEINTDVPFKTGITLEIGLSSDNDKAIDKDNMPLNALEYVRYRHAKVHPQVSLSQEQGKGNPLKRFYIFDKNALQSKDSEKNKTKDRAMQRYLEISKKPEQIEQMLTLMGEDIRTFRGATEDITADLKLSRLRELAQTKADLFLERDAEGELETRAWIKNLVFTQVLKQIGPRFLDAETSDVIGNNIDEAIVFLKDEANSQFVVALKARYQEAAAQPVKENVRRTVV